MEEKEYLKGDAWTMRFQDSLKIRSCWFKGKVVVRIGHIHAQL